MNTAMLNTLADTRIQEIRRDAEARHQAEQAQAQSQPAARWANGMRNRVGYTLVAAGLRMVVSSGE